MRLHFPNINKLKLAKYVGLPLAVGVGVGVLLLRTDSDDMKSAPQRDADHAAFRAAVIEEMRGRMTNDQDPLDVGRFRIGTASAHIGATATKDRLTEARVLIDLQFTEALKKAGLKRGEDPEFETGWRCATWLLDGPKGNAPDGLLPPTRAAYNAGEFATVSERCSGAEANLMAQNGRPDGNFHYLIGVSHDWMPASSAPAIPAGPGPEVVSTVVMHR